MTTELLICLAQMMATNMTVEQIKAFLEEEIKYARGNIAEHEFLGYGAGYDDGEIEAYKKVLDFINGYL